MTVEASSGYGPRIFWPRLPAGRKKNIKIQESLSRVEFIIGGVMLAIGGFVLRQKNSYDLIVIGSVLLVLASIHFYFLYKQRESSRCSISRDDRLLNRLRRQLNSDYSVALDYPLSKEKRIDYLIMGPMGLYLVRRVNGRGQIKGGLADKKWQIQSSSGQQRELKNPLPELENLVHLCKKHLQKNKEKPGRVDVRAAVVFPFHNVEGALLDSKKVFSLESFVPFLLGLEKKHDWETINELEDYLNVNNYTISNKSHTSACSEH
ncbi:MAG: NERD domain-containing protein [bacterium]